MPHYLNGPPPGPIARLLAGIVGLLALAGAVFFGLFLFAAAIGVGLVAWAVIWLRLWWIRRRLGAAGRTPGDAFRPDAGRGPASGRDAIDAEYEVVSRTERDD